MQSDVCVDHKIAFHAVLEQRPLGGARACGAMCRATVNVVPSVK